MTIRITFFSIGYEFFYPNMDADEKQKPTPLGDPRNIYDRINQIISYALAVCVLLFSLKI